MQKEKEIETLKLLIEIEEKAALSGDPAFDSYRLYCLRVKLAIAEAGL